MNRELSNRQSLNYFFLLALTLICTILSSLSANAQICQGSYDQEDIDGGDFRIDRPFMCGTGMMEHQMYQDRMEREKKGFFDIEGFVFYGSQGYYQKDEKLYYSAHPDTFTQVPNGDIATLEVVGNFLRDKNYIYSNGIAQLNVNVKSFQVVLNSPYAVDVNNVYYSDSRGGVSYSKGVHVIDGADSESFEELCDNESNGSCYYYGKDESHVYYAGVIIPEADVKTFRLEEHGYATDSKFAYFNGEKLENSSGESFELVTYSYMKDENNVYYYGQIIPKMIGKDFKLIGDSGMGTDGVRICYGSKVFENGDPITFVDLGCGYYKDANNVYSKGQVWTEIDAKSFEVIEWGFTKDKNSVYCDDVIIPGANPISFEVLGRKYSRDNKHVFYLRNTLSDCDESSFVVDSGDYNKGEDSKATYYRGKRTLK